MPALIDESTQYVDVNGSPLNAGKIYIGSQNLDPVVNPVTIYSDRELTIVLANPVTLDSLGRPSSKIWVSGRYSLRVQDVDGVQQLEELDNGEEPSTGISSLSSVLGTNTITAEASPTISAYVDLQLYTFTVINANTGAVTLNIDGNGALAIKKNHDEDLEANDFVADQVVIVSYNGTDDNFAWVDQKTITSFIKGADIASASPLVIGTDGQYFDVTGTTGFSAMTVGADTFFVLQFDGILTMTHGASLNLPGGVDITTAVGDEAICYATAANIVRVINYERADGRSVVSAFENQLLHIQDQKATSTAGGTFTLGAERTRDLNTVLTNEITGSSLATNQITLPAGNYFAIASAPCWQVLINRATLYNNTGTAILLTGTGGTTTTGTGTLFRSWVSGKFTLSVESVLELQHRSSATKATDGYGMAATFGPHEVYSEVKIWKVGE